MASILGSRSYKVFLFLEDSGLWISVALVSPFNPQEKVIFSFSKNSPEDCLEELKLRLGRYAEVYTFFTTQVGYRHLEICGKNPLFIDPSVSNPSLDLAKASKEKFLATYCSNFEQYNQENPARLEAKAKMLLHICCGPDAGGVIGQLKEHFDLLCFWYDPNIQPQSEYERRLDAFKLVASIESVPFIVGEYDVATFFERIRGLEHTPEQGAKCSACYDLRLERSAFEAKNQGCDLYATTLAISPHKVQEKLARFGEVNFKKYGVPYYKKNFMKAGGFDDSVAYSEKHNIYRQDYCGCYFSLHEGGSQARKMARELGLDRDNLREGFKNEKNSIIH